MGLVWTWPVQPGRLLGAVLRGVDVPVAGYDAAVRPEPADEVLRTAIIRVKRVSAFTLAALLVTGAVLNRLAL